MAGLILETAYVEIRPLTTGFGAAAAAGTRAGLAGSEAAIGRSGARSGALFAGGLAKGLKGFAGITVAALSVEKLASTVRGAVQISGQLQKSTEAIGLEFGKSAGEVTKFANESAKIGIGPVFSQELSVRIGILAHNLGITQAKAADMTTGLQELGGSIAEIRGKKPEDLLGQLPLVLAGNLRSLKQLGFAFSNTQIKQEAVTEGLIKQTGALTPAAKAQAIYALLMQQSGFFQEQAAKHSGDLVNQQHRLTAEWEAAKGKLGTALLPAMTSLVTTLATDLPIAIKITTTAFGTIKNVLSPIADLVGGFHAVFELAFGIGLVAVIRSAVIKLATLGASFLGVGTAAATGAAEAVAAETAIGAGAVAQLPKIALLQGAFTTLGLSVAGIGSGLVAALSKLGADSPLFAILTGPPKDPSQRVGVSATVHSAVKGDSTESIISDAKSLLHVTLTPAQVAKLRKLQAEAGKTITDATLKAAEEIIFGKTVPKGTHLFDRIPKSALAPTKPKPFKPTTQLPANAAAQEQLLQDNLSSAQARDSVTAQEAALRQLAAFYRRLAEQKRFSVALKRALNVQALQADAEIRRLDAQSASDAQSAADTATQNAKDKKAAADQAVQDAKDKVQAAVDERRNTLDANLRIAQTTQGTLKDDIRAERALIAFYRERVRELKGTGSQLRAAIADLRGARGDLKALQDQEAQTRKDRITTRLTATEDRLKDNLTLAGFTKGTGDDRRALTALERFYQQRVNASKRGSAARRKWRIELESTRQQIKDLSATAKGVADAEKALIQQQAFSFLTTQQGFASNLAGNLLGSTAGLVGGTAGVAAGATPATPLPTPAGEDRLPGRQGIAAAAAREQGGATPRATQLETLIHLGRQQLTQLQLLRASNAHPEARTSRALTHSGTEVGAA